MDLLERGLDLLLFAQRLRQKSRFVVLNFVFLLAQQLCRGGRAGTLVAGGDERGKPALERVVSRDGEPRLVDEGAARKDAALDAEQPLTAVFRRQPLHCKSRVHVKGGKLAHGRAAARGALDADVPVVVGFKLQDALHGSAAPRPVFRLRGQNALPCALGGVHAVEHREKKRCPGGFSGLIRLCEHVQPGRKRERFVLQTAEAGRHL